MKHLIDGNGNIIKSVGLMQPGIEKLTYELGWRDEEKPEYDPKTQTLNGRYYDSINDVVTFHVISLNLDINVIKEGHYKEVGNTIREISSIVSVVKNIYDPLRDAPENIPEDFATLVREVQGLRQRANDEIEALTTVEEAVNYVVRGPEIEGYINQLKSFI